MDYLFLIVSMLSSVTRSLLSKRLSPHVSSSAGFGAVNTMLFGAAFLLLVDNLARCLTAVEIPIGILTAFVGAPFFIYLMVKGGERA